MREIKFRVWDKNSKLWVAGWKLTQSGVNSSENNYEWMQYTGLKDKNGKEIYENMILDDEWEVIYQAPKYILQNISNNDILDIYENKHTITKEYSKL